MEIKLIILRLLDFEFTRHSSPSCLQRLELRWPDMAFQKCRELYPRASRNSPALRNVDRISPNPVHSKEAVSEPKSRLLQCVAPSFNGRTVGSEPINRGSNPWGATNTRPSDAICLK